MLARTIVPAALLAFASQACQPASPAPVVAGAAPAAPPSPAPSVVIGPDEPRAGESWTVERVSVDDVTRTPRGGAGPAVRLKVTRTETIRNTVVVVRDHRVERLTMEFLAKAKTIENLSKKTVKTVPDPTAGKRYLEVIDLQRERAAVLHEDGHAIDSVPENDSVVESAGVSARGYPSWGRHGLNEVPVKPISVGDRFRFEDAGDFQEASLALGAIRGDLCDFAIVMRRERGEQKHSMKATQTVRARDGRTVDYRAENDLTNVDAHDGIVDDVLAHATTTVHITYP